ncbi:MAG: hypothetical protein ACK5JM_14095 [Rhodoblastus sp.]
MKFQRTTHGKLLPAASAVAMALALVSGALLAPGGSVWGGSAWAQTAAGQGFKLGEDPFSVMLKWRPAARDKEMPDFVKNSRPAEGQLNFTPLVGPQVDRPRTKTPAELAADMKKFDSAAAAARARGPGFRRRQTRRAPPGEARNGEIAGFKAAF